MKKIKFIAFIAVLASFFLGVSFKASASSPSLHRFPSITFTQRHQV